MTHSTTIYRIEKDGVIHLFNSEKEACDFLKVAQCSVALCYRRNGFCKGWKIERIGISTHHETKTRLHKIWEGMHSRCENPNHKHYASYGGRGITVCDEWSEYVPFRDWAIKAGYRNNLTIDRIDVDGNYSPENCRWATIREQQNNKRSNHLICLDGVSHTIGEWSEMLGIRKTTLRMRLASGWDERKALLTPVRQRKSDMDGGTDND